MKKVNLANIEMLVMDVDGVLTDGTLVIHADGSESKHFNSLDGHGIRMWKRAGLDVALISGRASEPTTRRAEQLIAEACRALLPLGSRADGLEALARYVLERNR